METISKSNYELIKLVVTLITAIVAIITIIKGYLEYKKSVKQKRVELFIKYREKLKTHVVLINILELLETNNNEAIKKLSRFERYFFIGFYEEISLLVSSKIMRPEIAHYMFSYYAKLCWNNDAFWHDLNREGVYWRVFREFVDQMLAFEKKIIEIPVQQKINFKI